MAVGEFTDAESVKRVARLTNEMSDEDINEFVDTVNQQVLREHGFPVARSRMDVDEDRGSYFVNRELRPVHKIDRVFLEGSLLGEGSYTKVPGSGAIYLKDSLETSADGSVLKIDYIPKIYHELATFVAARDVIQSQFLISSEGASFPRISWFNNKIENITMNLSRDVMYRSSAYSTWDAENGEFVLQDGLGHNA